MIGRFISADTFASTGQGFIGCNMFAYCNNNPVGYCDPSGNFGIITAIIVGGIIGGIAGAAATWAAGGDTTEIVTAAVAGMGSGMAAATGPIGLGVSAAINAYATFEIDLHAQRRTNPAGVQPNYKRARIKAAASGLLTLINGAYSSEMLSFIAPNELDFAAYTVSSGFFSLTNAAIGLPVSYAIDNAFKTGGSNPSYTHSNNTIVKPHYSNRPWNANYS